MSEDVLTCILCGSNRNAFFDRREFRGRPVTNRICLDCGLVFQSPRMTETESAAFYAEDYRLLQEGSVSPTARNMAAQEARARSLLEFVRQVLSSVSRHLDIGCSLGILLKHFQNAYQNQAVGVEPGEAHRLQAGKSGLKVYYSIEDLEKAGEARFDLVSMSHVLEHLPEPIGYLGHLRDAILAPDGWLLIEVPNLFAHDSFEVAHLYSFSSHTLGEVLHQAGFEIVKFEKHGRPTSALFPLFLTALCRPVTQPGPHPARPERFVVAKRQFGMLLRRTLSILFPRRAWLVRG